MKLLVLCLALIGCSQSTTPCNLSYYANSSLDATQALTYANQSDILNSSQCGPTALYDFTKEL